MAKQRNGKEFSGRAVIQGLLGIAFLSAGMSFAMLAIGLRRTGEGGSVPLMMTKPFLAGTAALLLAISVYFFIISARNRNSR